MKPIIPSHLVGGAILVEATPLTRGVARVFRGVDLGAEIGRARDDFTSISSEPYREIPANILSIPTPVVVRLVSDFDEGVAYHHPLFVRMTVARKRMSGTPAPQLLSTWGLEGNAMASVEEFLVGTTLVELIALLRTKGLRMPVPIALAIGRGLLPMWMAAVPVNIRVSLDTRGIVIDPLGRVRVIPTYREEQSRHIVGAALFSLQELVAMTSPEEIMGNEPDGQSAMFYLGLLLYEMIAGAHPVGSTDRRLFETLTEIAQRDVPPLRIHRPDVHPTVVDLVHRCLARNPAGRLDSWHALLAAYAGVQALFPPTGSAEILEYISGVFPKHLRRGPPRVSVSEGWKAFPSMGYVPVQLSALRVEAPEAAPALPRPMPVIDSGVAYPCVDARPMYRISGGLFIDARPVTRAEIERYFLVTRTQPPAHLGALDTSTDDDPCVLVSAEVAEAYARWAGKRIPTEAEWDAAIAVFGDVRLGMGMIWEWTSTPHDAGGRVIRGGRWRDQLTLASRPLNRSFSTSPAADIGFRCVADIE